MKGAPAGAATGVALGAPAGLASRAASGLAVLAVVSLVACLGVGCVSTPGESTTGSLSAVREADIEALLETGDSLRALQAIDFYKREGSDMSAARLELLREDAVETLRRSFLDAVEDGGFREALRLYTSLRAVGQGGSVGEWDLETLLDRTSRQYGDEGLEVLEIYYAFQALAQAPQVARADELLQRLETYGDQAVLAYLIREMEERGLEIPARLQQAKDPVPLYALSQGTVTVLVDKGLKFVNRVGVPDRVVGSGFFIDARGYLLTNHHVISSEVDPTYEGYSRLYITRAGRVGEKIPARVVGYDRVLDLALLKVDTEPEYHYYPALETRTRPGETIVAIGSPVSLENTLNSGIVSAVGRRFFQVGDAMQIDVPVNPGNSGGPLLNARHEVVGVVFAGIEQLEGINFAIPNTWVSKVLPRLFDGGEIEYAWLGVSVSESEQGLEVIYALPGSPAAQAGVEPGDVLVSIDDRALEGLGQAQGMLMGLDPTTLVGLRWLSGGDERAGIVALTERPFVPIEEALERDERDRVIYPLFGMKLERIGQGLSRAKYVVRRVIPGSYADEIGLTVDDPVIIRDWKVDTDNRIAVINMEVRRKTSGYLDGVIQLYAYLEPDSFL